MKGDKRWACADMRTSLPFAIAGPHAHAAPQTKSEGEPSPGCRLISIIPHSEDMQSKRHKFARKGSQVGHVKLGCATAILELNAPAGSREAT